MNQKLAERPAHVPVDLVVDFDVYDPITGAEEYHQAWHKLRQDGLPDLIWSPHQGGHWVVLGGQLVDKVMADYENFSNRIIAVPKEIGEFGNILPMTSDPPAHGHYRNVLNSSLAPRAIRAAEDRIRNLAISLIEAVRGTGSCDFNTSYAEILPIQIFLDMMDLPLSDAPKLTALTHQVIRPTGSLADPLAGLYGYIRPVVEARRGGQGTDIVSRLANGTINGEPVDMATTLSLCVNILIGGLDTVVNFLGFAMLFLARSPAHRQQLAENPQLIPNAIMELGRRFGVVLAAREIRHDMEVNGVSLKGGEMIVVPTLMNGLDSRENAHPLEVNFNRDSIRQTLFGNGSHKCPGALLARTEIRITLEEWLARIPNFEVAPGRTIEFKGGIICGIKQLPLVWAVPPDAKASGGTAHP
jgi:camphor 5-monooxygenase